MALTDTNYFVPIQVAGLLADRAGDRLSPLQPAERGASHQQNGRRGSPAAA